jgi:hypothetical protein
MTDPAAIAALRARLSKAGLSAADADWLHRIGWSDAAVPAIDSDAQSIDYQRKLAAAIGARVADWNDKGGDEE